MIIYGINPALEALRAGTVSRLWARAEAGARVARIVARATRAGVAVQRVDVAELDRLAAGAPHQGVAAEVAGPPRCTLDELLRDAAAPPLLVVLDGIEDPRNFGAVARTAEAAGVDGLIHQTRRSAPLGATAARTSAGALAHLRVAAVVNISRALEELRRAGVWTVGLAEDAERPYHSLDLTAPTALVIGAEGSGLRRLVRERCDWLASIPMRGQVSSLNVSVAAGIALFEAVRQRAGAAAGGLNDAKRAAMDRKQPPLADSVLE